VLQPITSTFDAASFPDLLVGLEGPDDAAVYRLTDDLAIVQTVDFFPPVVDDPYTFGAIAAANAMSDVYAMGGEVLMALNIAAFPEDLDPTILATIFRGGAEKVRQAGGVIAGGHTIYDVEPKHGLAVTGTIHPQQILTKGGAHPGDALVLTKPLGTGIVLTAARAGTPCDDELALAIESMLTLNRHASHLAREFGAHAMTDVTGFGLLGHASEIAARSSVRVVIDAARVPPFSRGVLGLIEQGVTTGGAARNKDGLQHRVDIAASVPSEVVDLLYDPQTSGGLLVALDPQSAQAISDRLRADGLSSAIVGRVEPGDGVQVV
jgi:selenide,water dikinase